MQHDIVHRFITGQDRGQHNPVVVAPRFFANHGNLVTIRCHIQQIFQTAHARQTITHQHQLHFFLLHAIIGDIGFLCGRTDKNPALFNFAWKHQ